jgi:alkanesulfonate monooxygenase SsuD/methylene tetrahydromethanopterin reductase-like flavin-dependent oxidoreductase (luciferase family)
MIEIGIFDTGGSDLPGKMTESGIRIVDAGISEIQEMAQRLTIAQTRRTVLADRLGYDLFWNSEHHFSVEGSELSPNPLQTQTAAAVLTKRIRLGQMANIVTWHHPLRLAEQIGILDVLSGGRVDVGLGRGYQTREIDVFGHTYGASTADSEKSRAVYEEAHEILMKAWTQNSFSHHGQFFQVPPTWVKWNHSQTIAYFSEPGRDVNEVFRLAPTDPKAGGPELTRSATTLRQLSVLPQPVQKPHPPLWEPFATDRSIRYAASHGLNGNFSIQDNKTLREKIGVYMQAAADAGWPDYQDRGEFRWGWDGGHRRGVSAVRWIHVEEGSVGNLKRARDVQRRHQDFFHPFGLATRLLPPGESRVTPERLEELEVNIFGSKQQVLEAILRVRDIAYPEGDFIINLEFEQAAANFEDCEEQMQFFAEEIIPELRRECGGGPDLPESTVSVEPDYTAASV